MTYNPALAGEGPRKTSAIEVEDGFKQSHSVSDMAPSSSRKHSCAKDSCACKEARASTEGKLFHHGHPMRLWNCPGTGRVSRSGVPVASLQTFSLCCQLMTWRALVRFEDLSFLSSHAPQEEEAPQKGAPGLFRAAWAAALVCWPVWWLLPGGDWCALGHLLSIARGHEGPSDSSGRQLQTGGQMSLDYSI